MNNLKDIVMPDDFDTKNLAINLTNAKSTGAGITIYTKTDLIFIGHEILQSSIITIEEVTVQPAAINAKEAA